MDSKRRCNSGSGTLSRRALWAITRGRWPFGIMLDELPRGVSKLRKRVIGRVFHEIGLAQQWGSGAQRMIAACREAGLAAPVREEIGTGPKEPKRKYYRAGD